MTDTEDWELLQSDSSSVEDIKEFEVLSYDSQVLIRSDYLNLDSQSKFEETSGAQYLSDDGLIGESEGIKEVGFFENDRTEIVGRDLGDAENENFELGYHEVERIEVGFDGVEDIVDNDLGIAKNEDGLVGGVNEGENSRIFLSDSIGIEGNTEMGDGTNSNLGDELVSGGGGRDGDDADIVGGDRKSGGDGENRIMVWWKLPFEFMKYCALRTGSVWTVSMAAAVMGFVILGRRYYNLKRKSRSVQVNVTMDDKKVSQFKSRVVRLNEAISVVKHIPIIRTSLPAGGVTPWPVIAMR